MRTIDHPDIESEELSVADSRNGKTTFPRPGAMPDSARGKEFAHELVYDLRLEESRSDRFYADVTAFSAQVLAEVGRRAGAALDGYARYVADVLGEAPRSRGEYALELLTVGMALRLYGEGAEATPGWVIDLARGLFWLRRRSPAMKAITDFLRAGLFQLFMRRKLPGAGPAARSYMGPSASEEYRFDRLPRLIEWLQATGEFEQETRRLDNWRSYLRDVPAREAEGWIAVSVSLFDWFTGEAEAALGKYTAGVMRFLEKTCAARFWREDQIFCGRLPVEYHLGMVAAEVMNDGLRDDFSRKPRKVLLVPTCMRGAHRVDCKAVVRGLDVICAGCDPECAINRITKRMRAHGVQVFMVPHASGFSRWLEHWQEDPTVGVAAVACMMNILAGGYEMRARRIASQCVPLDFPGCQKHWTSNGVPTAVNEERLVQIVTAPQERG